MNTIYKTFLTALLALSLPLAAPAADKGLDKALMLYRSGLYADAMTLLQGLPQYGDDPVVDGYYALCAIKQHTEGYDTVVGNYLDRYHTGAICDQLRFEKALDLFDEGSWDDALGYFRSFDPDRIGQKNAAEYHFKKGYCYYGTGQHHEALQEFDRVDRMPLNDYSAPAQYCAGYISYIAGDIASARPWFEKSAVDERFGPISNYYIVNCMYGAKEYSAVVEKGREMFESGNVPQDRRAHLARIISESYLVLGDSEKAGRFFKVSDDGAEKTRGDYFFAGSLMYATGDWQGAVDNFSQMTDKTDSLGQIAWYRTALSYIEMKNKVAALDAFRSAYQTDFDAKMTEDAHFNYAKLAFDLNGDTSGFGTYRSKYDSKVRGEMIYSYMALAALQDRDYQAAIEWYDKIDVLEGAQKNNYVHANYLRGAELLDNGSYRNAMQCMKAVTYYTPKNDRVNQLARYALGEAYYRNSQYVDAQNQFTELFNSSALFGMEQNRLLPYNVAYSLYKQGNYAKAADWFRRYCSQNETSMPEDLEKDALLRQGDCFIAVKDYKKAVEAYDAVLDKYFDVNDIYPYYQDAVANGLLKKDDRKIELLEKALQANPAADYYGEALLELGRSQVARKHNDEALKVFQTVADKAPDVYSKARAVLETGTLYRNSGKTDKALDCYKSVVENMQQSGCGDDALLAIESIYQSKNSPAEYLAYLDRIGRGESKTEADKQEMIFNAAEQIFYDNDYQKALAAFQNFKQTYPASERNAKVDFYTGECYRYLGDKVMACDCYSAAMQGGDPEVALDATKQFAMASLSLENYGSAYPAFESLLSLAKQPAVKAQAKIGMMRSAYGGKNFGAAVEASSAVLNDTYVDELDKREAHMTKAKSLLASGSRIEALDELAILAAEPKTPEGAEASYMLVQDCFDKADYEGVKTRVYAFADAGGDQYYLAKSFILLGDSYAEQGKMKQAKATFNSIAEGYTATGDGILDDVRMRLEKLKDVQL